MIASLVVGGADEEEGIDVHALVAMAGVCGRVRAVVLGDQVCWETCKGVVVDALGETPKGVDDKFMAMHRLFKFSTEDDTVRRTQLF